MLKQVLENKQPTTDKQAKQTKNLYNDKHTSHSSIPEMLRQKKRDNLSSLLPRKHVNLLLREKKTKKLEQANKRL